MKKAVIFDLDGTLTDTLDSIKYCADAAIAVCGYAPYDKDDYKYFVGEGAARLIEKCLIGRGDEELVNFDKVFAAYKKVFAENCMYNVRPYDGIRDLLAALKDAGVKIAVLSNKPHAETIDVIETLFGKGYFDIIHGQKPEVERKPVRQACSAFYRNWAFLWMRWHTLAIPAPTCRPAKAQARLR